MKQPLNCIEPPGEAGSPADAEDSGDEAEVREALVSPPQHGSRLDHVLVAIAPEFSRSHLQRLLAEGHVQVDGGAGGAASRRMRAGQRVRVELQPTAEALAFRPQDLPVDAVHEDAHVLVLDKPVGCVVHPAPGHWSGTLLNALLHRHPASASLPRAGIVHRLDKDTSGLMVVGLTLEAVTGLVRAIAAREVRREYIALVRGDGSKLPVAIEAPIGRDPASRLRMAVVGSGKPARTDLQWLGQHEGVAAVRCRLHTGRTHQIRVHLSHAGFPLVGDALYGGAPALGMQRQALHAQRLGFQHPVTGELLDFERSPPADLAAAWRAVMGA